MECGKKIKKRKQPIRLLVGLNWRQFITYNIMGHLKFTKKLMAWFLTQLEKRNSKWVYKKITVEDIYGNGA